MPDLLMSARATKGSSRLLRPLLATTGAQPAGRVVLGTVTGDMHDIGKNLVAVMLEGGGFEVTDLGVDVPPDRFVAAVERTGARIVGLSALLTTTSAGHEGDARGHSRGRSRARTSRSSSAARP